MLNGMALVRYFHQHPVACMHVIADCLTIDATTAISAIYATSLIESAAWTSRCWSCSL